MKPFLRKASLLLLAGAGLAQTSGATSYTLITEPNQGLTPIYNLINSAKHTIDMTMYELSDTTAEQDLANQAAAGVTVRVILDTNLEKSNNQAAYTFLNANGVQCHWANTTYAATHQKTITIDGAYSNAQTAIMTLNLTPQYYSTSRDFAIIENDPNDIAAIEATFQADFNSAAITPSLGDDLVWSPTNSSTAMVNLITSAQHTLLVENEEMSDTAIVNALVAAAKRGVNVQISMQAGTSYTSEWAKITAAGGDVSTYAATAPLYIHAKVIIADYGYSTASFFQGSENFSSASLTENRELGLIINNLPLMASLATTLTQDFNGGVPQTGSPANFTLLPSASTLSVASGSSAGVTVTATPFNSFKTAVALSAFGLPTGVTASFSPATISGGSGTAAVTFTASASTVAGTYLVGILGTGGSIKNSTAINLTVTGGGTPGFSLSASPSSVSLQDGGSATTTITSTVSGGFSSAVSLSASGLPSGVTAGFSPSSIAAPGSGSSTLTLTATASAAAGTYTVTITGVGGGLTQTTTVSLTVSTGTTPGFTLKASPASLTVQQGASGTSTITATTSGGFDAAIALSASGLPSGVTAGFNPASIASPGSGSSTLTLTASSGAATGADAITITGTGSGGVVNNTSVALTVTGSSTNLIQNGGFETGSFTGWTTGGAFAPAVTTAEAESGTYSALLGHTTEPEVDGNSHIYQTIAIPSTATTATLNFYYWPGTNDAIQYVSQECLILNTSGTTLATVLHVASNTRAWEQVTYNLASYAGQTIRVYFAVTGNGYSDYVYMYVDNVSVTVQ